VIKKATQLPFWKRAPFFRLLIPLIVGILVEKNNPVLVEYPIAIIGLSLLTFMLTTFISLPEFFRITWISGAAIHSAFFAFGVLLMFIHQDNPLKTGGPAISNKSDILLLEILNDPVPRQNSYKCLARINWLIKNDTCYYANEKLLVYFSPRPDTGLLTAGSKIFIHKSLQPVENFKNNGFDYKKYCRLKHIYSQVFIKENDFLFAGKQNENFISTWLARLRIETLDIIRKHIPGKSENSLLEALLIGFTDDMDPALLKAFADTGVIHIIAISGLHLALICHLLELLFNQLGRNTAGRWIKYILIIFCLWGYSLFSGASPSVIRAAMMFSLVLFARNMLRQPDLYNILAASAFLLLCFDPNWLWDTGFQLSYTAVLSLALFSIPVKTLFVPQNKILKALWGAASVSIAAQILITPVCLYYFRRFPTYFLISNMLAVPLSSGILLGGILLCIFHWVPPAGIFLGWLLKLMIICLNGFIQFVSHLPAAVVTPLELSGPGLVLTYLNIYCFYRVLLFRQKHWLLIALSAISLFLISRLYFGLTLPG
jgi:competence protein ComEC